MNWSRIFFKQISPQTRRLTSQSIENLTQGTVVEICIVCRVCCSENQNACSFELCVWRYEWARKPTNCQSVILLNRTHIHSSIRSMYSNQQQISIKFQNIFIGICVFVCFIHFTFYSVYFSLSSYDGYLDPKLLESINVHWVRFVPPKPWEHYTLATILLFIMVVGMIGNFLVVYMFFRYVVYKSTIYTN